MFRKDVKPLHYGHDEDRLDALLYCMILLIIGAISFINAALYTPEAAIRSALQRRGITASALELEQIGDKPIYRLSHPPLDPETDLPLENWEIQTQAGLLSCPKYAVSLDLPEK